MYVWRNQKFLKIAWLIKKRFKELAKIYHPDLNGGDEEKMKKLNEYRDILMQAYGK